METVNGIETNLGSNTKFASAPIGWESSPMGDLLASAKTSNRARRWMEQIATGEPRMVRYAQLAFLRERLPNQFRTKYCLSHLQYNRDYLSLVYSHEHNKAHFRGAAVCGSVWTCPICSERITAIRRNDLKKLAAATNYVLIHVIYTQRHQYGESLKPMVDGLNNAVRAMKSHRPWRRFKAKWGVVGHVHSLEVTYGHNGWHPHRHEMLVLDPGKLGVSGADAKRIYETEMQSDLFAMYQTELHRAGLDCDESHGVKVSANRKDFGDYIAKWGVTEEITRSTDKLASGGGKSVWDLLTDAVNGDTAGWKLFLEYAQAFKGKKQLHWSRGLRDLLALPTEEMSDQEAAEAVQLPDLETLVEFSKFGLYYIRDKDLFGPVRIYTEKVHGDVDLVLAFLARMGLRKYIIGNLPEGRIPVHDQNEHIRKKVWSQTQIQQEEEVTPPLPGYVACE